DAVIVFQRFLAMPPTSFPGLFGPGSGSGSSMSGTYPLSPIAPPSPTVQASMSSGTSAGYSTSPAKTRPAVIRQQPPATPPADDVDILDEVLSDPMRALLTV
ncbi:MAG: hypothetical protein R3C19_23400, partial [Planctomycetaceae bacterium]